METLKFWDIDTDDLVYTVYISLEKDDKITRESLIKKMENTYSRAAGRRLFAEVE